MHSAGGVLDPCQQHSPQSSQRESFLPDLRQSLIEVARQGGELLRPDQLRSRLGISSSSSTKPAICALVRARSRDSKLAITSLTEVTIASLTMRRACVQATQSA